MYRVGHIAINDLVDLVADEDKRRDRREVHLRGA